MSGDDVADPLGRALLRIQGGSPRCQLPQLTTQLLELGDAGVELGGTALEQVGDVGAGCLSVVAEGDDLADLAQGEADRLGGADEPEPAQGRRVIGPVAGGGAGRWGQDADLLVVADGLGRDAGLLGQFTDPHARPLSP
jgi:hypothetical protein